MANEPAAGAFAVSPSPSLKRTSSANAAVPSCSEGPPSNAAVSGSVRCCCAPLSVIVTSTEDALPAVRPEGRLRRTPDPHPVARSAPPQHPIRLNRQCHDQPLAWVSRLEKCAIQATNNKEPAPKGNGRGSGPLITLHRAMLSQGPASTRGETPPSLSATRRGVTAPPSRALDNRGPPSAARRPGDPVPSLTFQGPARPSGRAGPGASTGRMMFTAVFVGQRGRLRRKGTRTEPRSLRRRRCRWPAPR